jgi:hypothetical protein
LLEEELPLMDYLLRPMSAFPAADPSHETVVADALQHCGLAALQPILIDDLHWHSLPLIRFGLELLRASEAISQAFIETLRSRHDPALVALFAKVVSRETTVALVVAAPEPDASLDDDDLEDADDTPTFNELLRTDHDALSSLLRDPAIFDPAQSHVVTVPRCLHARTVRQLLASVAVFFQPRILMLIYTGHGAALPHGRAELEFCQGRLPTQDLSLLLLACRAANTLVFLDCCYASGVFSGEVFPGLAVLPAQSATRETPFGFSREVLAPVLRGQCDGDL